MISLSARGPAPAGATDSRSSVNPQLTDAKALDLIHKALECEDFEQLLRESLNDFRVLLDADTACAFELANTEGKLVVGRSLTVGMDDRVLGAYGQEFVQMDPVCRNLFLAGGAHVQSCHNIRMLRLSERIDQTFKDHRYYWNDFIVPEHLNHVLGISFRSTLPDQPLLVFGFHRGRRGRDFDSANIRRASVVSNAFLSRFDHFSLQVAYAHLQRQLTLSEERISFEILLDRKDHAVVHLLLGNNKVSVYRSDNKNIFHPGLRTLLNETARRDCCSAEHLTILRGVGICGIPASYSVQVKHELSGPTCDVYRIDAIAPAIQDHLAQWAAKYELTHREVDIALKLMAGLRNQQIAQELDISIRTVENHLRSIYSKVGVSSRLKVMSSISAMMPDETCARVVAQ